MAVNFDAVPGIAMLHLRRSSESQLTFITRNGTIGKQVFFGLHAYLTIGKFRVTWPALDKTVAEELKQLFTLGSMEIKVEDHGQGLHQPKGSTAFDCTINSAYPFISQGQDVSKAVPKEP